jgi:CheY-like chemotaxis protein
MARVLIVDDQAATVDLISASLRLLGHEPISAYNGEQALELLAKHEPEIVLLQSMSPKLSCST